MRKTLYLMALVLVAASSCSSSDSNEEMGASVAESVMEAWATGDQADIDAIYSEEVRRLSGLVIRLAIPWWGSIEFVMARSFATFSSTPNTSSGQRRQLHRASFAALHCCTQQST